MNALRLEADDVDREMGFNNQQQISNKPSWLRKTTDGLVDQLTDDTKAGEEKLAIQIDPNILPSIKGLD